MFLYLTNVIYNIHRTIYVDRLHDERQTQNNDDIYSRKHNVATLLFFNQRKSRQKSITYNNKRSETSSTNQHSRKQEAANETLKEVAKTR